MKGLLLTGGKVYTGKGGFEQAVYIEDGVIKKVGSDSEVAAFAPERIAPDLAGRAEALAQSRYRAWSWTFGESPKFVFERAFDAGGAPMCVRYAAERGEIRQIHVEGEGGARVARALNGARLALDELRARLWDAIADEARAQALLENLF